MVEIRCYRVGGVVFSLSGPPFRESEHLSPFRCPLRAGDLHIEVELTESPPPPPGRLLRRDLFTDYCEGGRLVRLDGGRVLFAEEILSPTHVRVRYSQYALQYYGSNMAMRILNLPERLLDFGGVFLHASYIEIKGRAILFAAPGGTGKSTQAALWEKHRGARIVNGDRVLLRKTRGTWLAFGSPYCGTSDICLDVTCPVEAMVLLGRSRENTLRPAHPREGLRALLSGFTYDARTPEQTQAVLSLAEDLIRSVPMYRLDCRPDAGAVEILERTLWPNPCCPLT